MLDAWLLVVIWSVMKQTKVWWYYKIIVCEKERSNLMFASSKNMNTQLKSREGNENIKFVLLQQKLNWSPYFHCPPPFDGHFEAKRDPKGPKGPYAPTQLKPEGHRQCQVCIALAEFPHFHLYPPPFEGHFEAKKGPKGPKSPYAPRCMHHIHYENMTLNITLKNQINAENCDNKGYQWCWKLSIGL